MTGKGEWFRNSKWNNSIAEVFHAKLARALIYWEQGQKEVARTNADMAVRFGNIRKHGLSITFDKSVVKFEDKPTLKRLLSILKQTQPQ
jgi:uncharacterized membrane protein YfbV (UPF0208 family)